MKDQSRLESVTRRRLVVSGVVISVCLACLPPERSIEAPPYVPQSCTPGVRFCDDNEAKICGEDGRVAERIACEPTQTCFGGFCDDNRICEPDSRYCVLNELKRCNSAGTELTLEQDCADMACVNGACIPVSGTCPPSAALCIGNAAAVCNDSGSGYLSGPSDCGADATCINGSCEQAVCQAGQSSCADNVALTCNAWGTGYSYQETCSGSSMCVSGRCQLLVCQPGLHCQGNTAVSCNDDGTAVIESETCAEEMRCEQGRCVPIAVDAGVTDGALPDTARLDSTAPDRASADATRPDTTVPDRAQPDTALPDTRPPDTWQPPSCDPIDDSYEPNDERSAARTIANDATLSNLVACDQADWFKTTVPDDRSLTVTATFSHAEVDIDLKIYEAGDSNQYTSSMSTTDNESAEYTGTVDSIFIEIDNYTWPDQSGSYSLTLSLGEPPVCGDGRVSGAEQCDIAIASGNTGACPTSCSDSYCSLRTLEGGGSCQARCASTPITHCANGDECCPEICSAHTDDYCPSGWAPCSSDSNCPADRYCDLQRATPVCKLGCRPGVAGACDSEHRCSQDHRCVLANVVPHQRCAACDDGNPCDPGFGCTYLINVCAPSCNILFDDCADQVGAGELCLLTICSMSDCP